MSNLMNKTAVSLITILFTILAAGSALADSLDIEVDRGAFVYNADSSQARLMLKFAMPEELDSTRILFAELRVPISTIIPDSSAITIYCRPILITWAPENASWDMLGDLPDSSVVSKRGTHFGTPEMGQVVAYFDISRIMKKWQDGSLANNGLVIYANPRQLPRFAYLRQWNEPFGIVHIKYEFIN